MTGRTRNPSADQHEPGLVLWVILDIGGEHFEAVEVGGQRVADRGEVAALRSISRWIRSSLSKASVSRVTDTEPSIMFSMGTTPASTSPRSTAAITSGTDPCGVRVAAARSVCVSSASSVKVPAGPKYATRCTAES